MRNGLNRDLLSKRSSVLKLFNIKIKHLFIKNISFQSITNNHCTNSNRCTGKQNITNLNSKETRNIAYKFMNWKNHISRISMLNSFAVNIQSKLDILHINQLLYRQKITDNGWIIKGFTNLPRLAFGFQLPLQITCRKIDTQTNFSIIAMRKFWVDIFP